MKIKIKPADSIFSNEIRGRDEWTCQRCGGQHTPPTQGLHCSHYWGRGNKKTRFDPRNCIALCYPCHQLWGHGDERDDYKKHMKELLGKTEFKDLEKCARMNISFGDSEFKEMAKFLRANGLNGLQEYVSTLK